MKQIKFLIGVLLIMLLMSCTDNIRTRTFGGSSNIILPQGQKLVNMTWKEMDLWILTVQMDSAYKPKTYTFKESSSWGILQGDITVMEVK